MKHSKVLYVSQEVFPYSDANPVSEACRYLPQATLEQGHEIRTFMPKWANINERRNQLHEVIRLSGMNIIIDDTDHPLIIKVASIQQARMQVYFIENEDYFSRISLTEGTLLEPGFPDNDERCIFYARGVLETVKMLRWNPDVIHVHGWLGALVGLYAKVLYPDEPAYRSSRIILSLTGGDFRGTLRDDFLTLLRTKNMPDFDAAGIEAPFDCATLLRLAVRYADGVIVATPDADPAVVSYARELGKPILEATTSDTYYTDCQAFYDLVCGGDTPQ